MKAHTSSPVSTRRSNHAAYSNSPRTDNGDGVGANTSYLTVVAKSFSTHRDLTSPPIIRRAPTCEQNRFVGRYVSLFDPRVQLQIFHLPDFSFISRLDFVGGQSVDRRLHRSLEKPGRFSPLVPSLTHFHRSLVPVDEMSLVLFGSYPHPFGSPSSRCLSQRLFLTSLGWDVLNSNSGPAVVYPDLQQFRVSPPPLMLFGGSRPRHLDTSCIHECVTSLDRESHMPGIQEFCRFLTRKL